MTRWRALSVVNLPKPGLSMAITSLLTIFPCLWQMPTKCRIERLELWNEAAYLHYSLWSGDTQSPAEKELSRDLEAEYPAIFNWILEGRDRFIANGYKLTDSKELENVMDEYQSESSTVMKFMYQMNYLCRYEEIADIEPKWMSSAILYRKYCNGARTIIPKKRM